MFNYNTCYKNYPYSMYNNFRNSYANYNNYYTTSTIETNNINDTIINSNENTEKTTESNQNLNFENNVQNEKENGFRIGPLTVSNDKIEILGFSFAIDDLIIIGLMLIIFLDSDSDFVLLIILGLMLFNISFSSLNLF